MNAEKSIRNIDFFRKILTKLQQFKKYLSFIYAHD